MTSPLPRSLLSKFSAFINDEIGLHFPETRWHDLERGITSAAREFKFDGPENCIKWLMSSKLDRNQIEILASYLTIGETYFFRDKKLFDVVEKHILQPLIQERFYQSKNIRIWSAGCATGEEAYTISIILNRLIPVRRNWNITVLATDINIRSLNKLAKGIYSEWSFRNVPREIIKENFNQLEDGRYEIAPAIKEIVQASYLNLSEDSYPTLTNNTNAMDVIFCRNVMMYFSPALIRKVLKRFYACLTDNGVLLVNPSEVAHNYDSNFKPELIDGMTIYRKTNLAKPETSINSIENHKSNTSKKQMTKKLSVHLPIKQNPKQSIDYKALAQEKANQGKLHEALILCQKGVERNKTDSNLYYLQAMILAELGNSNDAIATLKKVLYLEPHSVLANFMLGNMAFKNGKKQDAKKYFQQALAWMHNLDPEEILPESGGMTVGRLINVIHSLQSME